jgi:hypothetical protein
VEIYLHSSIRLHGVYNFTFYLSRQGCEDNVKVDPPEMDCEDGTWMKLAQRPLASVS